VPLDNYYLMSGEEKKVKIDGKPSSVEILPLSRYGFKQNNVIIGVKP
jgi:hypothetical protein